MSSSVAPHDDLRAYSVVEVSERLGISRRSVQRMLESGTLRTLQPRRKGRTLRITASSLREALVGHQDGVQ